MDSSWGWKTFFTNSSVGWLVQLVPPFQFYPQWQLVRSSQFYHLGQLVHGLQFFLLHQLVPREQFFRQGQLFFLYYPSPSSFPL